MRKKCRTLALLLLVLAVATMALAFFMFHYLTPELTISPVWRPEPGKPFVTEMVAVLGVLFLFGSVMSLLVGNVFFPKR